MNHLDNAKQYLAIAEGADSRKEAYRSAAEEIAAHIDETGDQQKRVATLLGKDPGYVHQLLKWRRDGYQTDTPWLADTKATTRARASHARTVLRDPTERRHVIESMSADEVAEFVQTAVEVKPSTAKVVTDERERQVKEKVEKARQDTLNARPAPTVSQYYWRILKSFSQWQQGLQWIADEAHTLREHERPEVMSRLLELRGTIDQCLDAVEGKEADDVIDVQGSKVGQKVLSA